MSMGFSSFCFCIVVSTIPSGVGKCNSVKWRSSLDIQGFLRYNYLAYISKK